MAKKLRLMALFQELSGRAQMTNRRPSPSAAGMYLMQLRSKSGAAVLPRRRFLITVDLPQSPLSPLPVKINHVSAPAPTLDPGARPTVVSTPVHPVKVPQVQSKAG